MYSDALNCILFIYKNFILCTLLGTESKFTIKVNCLIFSNRSPHVQLTDDERHSEDFLTHSAPTFNQCNESFKNQLTQSLTRNDCELRISKDSSWMRIYEIKTPVGKMIQTRSLLLKILMRLEKKACWIHVI